MTLPAVHGHTHKRGGSDPIDAAGIQFETYPQDGAWLYAETTDASGSPNGVGIEFYSSSGGIKLRTSGTGDITLDSGDDILATGDRIRLTAGSGSGADSGFTSENNLEILADGQLTLQGETTLVMLFPAGSLEVPDAANVNLRIITGATLTVLNNSFAPIFRVDEDGDLHGKTGKALTFDL